MAGASGTHFLNASIQVIRREFEMIRCIGCCPASEWWWFRWALAAQPVIAVITYLWAYG